MALILPNRVGGGADGISEFGSVLDFVEEDPGNPINPTYFDSSATGSYMDLSGDNLIVTKNAGEGEVWRSSFANVKHTTGKWYCEFLIGTASVGGFVGLAADYNYNKNAFIGANNDSWGVYVTTGNYFHNGNPNTPLLPCVSGDVVSLAYDADNDRMFLRRNSDSWLSQFAGQDPSTNSGGYSLPDLPMRVGVSLKKAGDSFTGRFSKGSFYHAIPEGYVAWDVLEESPPI